MAQIQPIGDLDSDLVASQSPIDNPPTLSDESLLRQFVDSGQKSCLEALIRRYQTELFSYLRRYLGDDDLAEDAFQLTFIRVYQKAMLFDTSRRFRPWLYGIATNQAIDLKRRLKRRTHQSLDIASTNENSRGSTHAAAIPDHRVPDGDPLESEELRRQIREAVDEIGEPGRSALELIYLQGLPYRDAAEALDVPIGTVKSRVHAAIRKLSAVWQRKHQQVEG